jgi:hypothetical protein
MVGIDRPASPAAGRNVRVNRSTPVSTTHVKVRCGAAAE